MAALKMLVVTVFHFNYRKVETSVNNRLSLLLKFDNIVIACIFGGFLFLSENVFDMKPECINYVAIVQNVDLSIIGGVCQWLKTDYNTRKNIIYYC